MSDRKAITCIERAVSAAPAPFETRDSQIDESAVPRLLRGCFWLLAGLLAAHVNEVEADDVLRERLLGWERP